MEKNMETTISGFLVCGFGLRVQASKFWIQGFGLMSSKAHLEVRARCVRFEVY